MAIFVIALIITIFINSLFFAHYLSKIIVGQLITKLSVCYQAVLKLTIFTLFSMVSMYYYSESIFFVISQLIVLSQFVGYAFTKWLIVVARRKNLMDIPNDRSSHVLATPRGGGISFVILFLGSLILTTLILNSIAIKNTYVYVMITLFIASGLVAGIGYLDDRYQLSAKKRFLIHVISALLVICGIGYISNISILNWQLSLGIVGAMFTVLMIIWMINLFNFMDGIDGLCASEAIFVIVGLLFLSQHIAPPSDSFGIMIEPFFMLYLYAFLSAFLLGFLYVNFPPAKIFMGDVGSGFLGLVVSVLLIYLSLNFDPNFFWIGLVLAGAFIVDATWTLMIRLIKRQRVTEGHRTHAYQYASRKYHSHKVVTLGVILINMVWLFPIAYLINLEKLSGIIGVLIAYFPLCVLCFYFKAGTPEAKK